MNSKQACFVSEYLVDLNATQAAIRAGYSVKTAQEQGSRLLSNVMVQREIQNAMQKREKRIELSQNQVLEDLELVKREAMKLMQVHNGKSVMTNANVALKALELQGKHLGMWGKSSEVDIQIHNSSLGQLTDAELEAQRMKAIKAILGED